MKKQIKFLIRISVSIILLCWLFSKVDIEHVVLNIVHGKFHFLIAAIMLYCAGQILSAFKWQYIVKLLRHTVALKFLVKYYFLGMFFNVFLPTS